MLPIVRGIAGEEGVNRVDLMRCGCRNPVVSLLSLLSLLSLQSVCLVLWQRSLSLPKRGCRCYCRCRRRCRCRRVAIAMSRCRILPVAIFGCLFSVSAVSVSAICLSLSLRQRSKWILFGEVVAVAVARKIAPGGYREIFAALASPKSPKCDLNG